MTNEAAEAARQEAIYDAADALALVLTDQPQTPSVLARKAKLPTAGHAAEALRWMVHNNYAVAVGNGAWTRYRTRNFGEIN